MAVELPKTSKKLSLKGPGTSWNEINVSRESVQNLPLLFMFLLTVKLVKNSHILARSLFIFVKEILKQT